MMGGLEKVQIEYINYLVENKNYELKVVIENDNGSENRLESFIKTKIIYLKSFEYISKIKKAREERRKNIINKIKYNYLIKKEREYSKNKFMEIYNEYQPDIVIDFDSSLIRFVSELKNSKNLVWIHSSIPRWKGKKAFKFTQNLEKYDKIISICKEMKEELEDLNANLKEKSEYIYNPLDFNKIKELSEEKIDIEDEKLSKEKFLLTVARLDLIPKDFETLFKGFDIAKDGGYDGKLYIIGDGPDKEGVEKLKNNSKYKADIILLGRKMNPYNWMKKADKFIMSSKYEGFGIVLLEALSLKKEIISSNCKTGPKELLNNGEFGTLFEVGDFEELGKKILEEFCIDEDDLEKHLKQFNIDTIYSKFFRILEG
jgi:glycosyltransferase involved in cell wall biosynthesis